MPFRLTCRPGYRMLILVIALCSYCELGAAQALTGTKSLITIPVGEIPPDGTVTVGGGFLNRKYTDYLEGRYHFTPYFFSIAFLPFLEVGLRFSRAISDEPQALGDRMVSVRLQLLRERRKRPSLVIGAHDFLRSTDNLTNNFNALYLVASKRVHPARYLHAINLHLGYGTDWIEAGHHQFTGLFGGAALALSPFLDVLLEYDGETVNVGQRLTLLKHVQLLVALQNFDTLAGGASFQFRL